MAFHLSNIRSAWNGLIGKEQPGAVIYSAAVPTMAGVPVSEEQALRLSAVHSCVRVLSEDIAALPIKIYKKRSDGGKDEADGHPLYNILHSSPNPEMTAVSFMECMMMNILLEGNAYMYKEYNNAGEIIGLWPLLSTGVTPYRDSRRRLMYRIGFESYSPFEILHIPGLSLDGIVGMSPIAYMRESIGLAQAAEAFGSKFFGNGTHLGGVISVQGKLSEESFNRAKEQFGKAYKGLINSHGIPVLEEGATYTPVGIKPDEAQFLETRKFQRSEIAAIYRVPPHMIGDLERATFSNIEHQDGAYLQRSLLPWLMRFSKGLEKGAMSEKDRRKHSIEHETGNFMRGDIKARYFAYAQGVNAGFMTPNEARAKENWNPKPDGDKLRIPAGVTQAGQNVDPNKKDPPKDPNKTE